MPIGSPRARPKTQRTSDSFEAFCVDNHASITRALSVSFGSVELGAEAANEAFARAFARWGRVSQMASPAGWVYTVGLNWGRRHLSRRRREHELTSQLSQPTTADLEFEDPDLVRALIALPPKIRAVVVLRKILDLSQIETSTALGIPEGTVKSRLNRGLTQLRHQLTEPHAARPTGRVSTPDTRHPHD